MRREWKRGDVAMVNGSVAVRTDDNLSWWTTSGRLSDPNVAHVRSLVVIDPEDNDFFWFPSRLRLDADRIGGTTAKVMRLVADQIEAQLVPPKPDEPTGLGAVVEDADGQKWVHRGRGFMTAWTRAAETVDDGFGRALPWSDIAAVRVLSEGVQA